MKLILLIYLNVLCKESIVITKKFDFEILAHLYSSRSSQFICDTRYAIFTVMDVCMWVNTIVSKRWIHLSSNLVCILQVTVALLILVNTVWKVFLFSTIKSSYTLRSMESNSFKCSSIQSVHLIELKFGVSIIKHR